MKRWVSTLMTAAGFAALAATGKWWKPWLLGLLDAQGNRIQALADLAQLAMWVFAGLTIFVKFWRSNRPDKKQEPQAQASTHVEAKARAVAVGGGVTDSNVITGDHNVVNRDSNVVNQPQQFRDLVMQQTVIQPSEAVTISPLHQIPQPPLDFTGRQQELDELMAASERGSIISGLQGQGGVGKTALALKLAEKLKPAYPDAQFYLELRGVGERPVTPAEAMAHVIRAYHPTARLPESEAELRPLFLSALHGQRALLLMDNAKDREQVEPLIPPAGCALLVTSRQHFTLPGLFAKRLDTLPPEVASELLLKIAPRIGEHADEIARLCGYLPLALRLAGGALAERMNLPPDDYARRLANAQQRFAPVDASLNLSYELLGEGRRRQWRLLAIFPATFDETAIAAVWETDVEAAQDAIGELVAYSLVEWEDDARRYHLHDLSRLFADAQMSDEENGAAKKRHAKHYLSVIGKANTAYLKGGDGTREGLALFDRERENIQSGQAWADKGKDSDYDNAQLCSDYVYFGWSLLVIRVPPHERINKIDAALTAARRLKRRDAEGWHLGNLGLAHYELGNLSRAIDFYEQHKLIAREVGDRRGEEYALNYQGRAYVDLGNTDHAIELLSQALDIAREISDQRGEVYVLNHLGLAYTNLGEIRRAIEFYQQSLVISCEIGLRRSQGFTFGYLGAAHADLDENRRAIEFYEQGLSIAREMGDRFVESDILWKMSLAFYKLDERAKAIALAEASLKIKEGSADSRAEKVREQLAEWRG
ncbi:MAG: tetratricopeptide repeat protein [Blastocatellales bacterium]